MCAKACGGGTQTKTVECRRTSDDVAVPDAWCEGPRPSGVASCNMQACTGAYAWNWNDYGDCSKTCGGGTKTRTVICQDQSGATVNDNLCPPPKPATSLTCNPDACTGNPTYAWVVTPGICSKQCGGG